ncbi:signal transduction histidine kinase, nitrogen specific, NtrB [Desulfatibacillum aliphaticivorans]|uniref:histidine kinase n=1 Tax=Desulfatibacillum aliphaticivorans TaxID=218208 RepID=B8FMN7_DESAL|nr:ATP-binding protein [Desulfatibacillum aliphaticivorans]ACL01904.1 signal transduction histidine kinase, nitrogen specific, NtrB [Desulfatibacillum aliphaticivorans]
MKISTRLRYNAAASVVLVCLLFVLLLSFSQSMKKQIATYNYANELLHKTSTLNALTHEYLMKHDQRSEKQWRYQFDDIMDSLGRNQNSEPMIRVRNNLDMLKNHYNKLNIEIQALKAMDPKAISEEESKRFKFSKRLLSDQMQICSQRILTHVFRITTEASQKLNELRTRSIYVLLLFGGFMVFITVLNAFTTLNRIARPLADLVKQVNVLEKTDFSKGILQETMWDTPNKNDEVGRLWAAFGDMKVRLAKAFRKINRELKDRQAAEQEVRERNAQLKELQDMLESIINSMPSMLVGIDSDGRITHWNSEAERQINLNMAQAEGRYLQDLLPALRPWVDEAKGTVKAGQPFKLEKQPLEINGKEIHADITLFPLVSGRQSGAVIRVDDVSERVAMDEIIIQSEKMLSVGGLAAGVAHEINNPLAGILQNMQVVINRLSTELPKNKAVAEKCNTSMEAVNAYLEAREIMRLLSLIRDSGERASAIVDNMLSFSRMNRSQPERRSLAELTDKTLELAASDYDLKKKYDFRSIKIMRDYEDSLPEVMCEAGKIQQVMLNLFKNAAQAMINGSSKSINPEIRLGLHRNGDMVDIEVEDNGPGVPKEIRSKIFEPFFTTKEVGEGTGLGLFVAYFIVVNNHHGSMRVESSPGKGAKFIVQLPIEQSGK